MNNRLRLVVSIMFFSSLSITVFLLATFLLIGVSLIAIQERLTIGPTLEKVQITETTNLREDVPYLGAILPSSGRGSSKQLSVLNFQIEIIQPLRYGIITAGAIVGFVLLTLIGLLGLIGFILSPDDAHQDLH